MFSFLALTFLLLAVGEFTAKLSFVRFSSSLIDHQYSIYQQRHEVWWNIWSLDRVYRVLHWTERVALLRRHGDHPSSPGHHPQARRFHLNLIMMSRCPVRLLAEEGHSSLCILNRLVLWDYSFLFLFYSIKATHISLVHCTVSFTLVYQLL